jgi:hypothetical protein
LLLLAFMPWFAWSAGGFFVAFALFVAWLALASPTG